MRGKNLGVGEEHQLNVPINGQLQETVEMFNENIEIEVFEMPKGVSKFSSIIKESPLSDENDSYWKHWVELNECEDTQESLEDAMLYEKLHDLHLKEENERYILERMETKARKEEKIKEGTNKKRECADLIENSPVIQAVEQVKDQTINNSIEVIKTKDKNKLTIKKDSQIIMYFNNYTLKKNYMCKICKTRGSRSSRKEHIKMHIQEYHGDEDEMKDKNGAETKTTTKKFVDTTSTDTRTIKDPANKEVAVYNGYKNSKNNDMREMSRVELDKITNQYLESKNVDDSAVWCCSECDIEPFKLKLYAKVHIETHMKLQIPCNDCKKVCTTTVNMKNHRSRKHPGIIMDFNNITILAPVLLKPEIENETLHENTRHKLKEISIKELNEKIDSILQMRKENEKSPNEWFCGMCDRNSSFVRTGIKNHVERHLNLKIVCLECKKSFSNTATLMTHRKMKHIHTKDWTKIKIFASEELSDSKDTRETLNQISSYENTVITSVEELNTQLEKFSLSYFGSSKSFASLWTCKLCDKTVTQKSNLRTHIQTHLHVRLRCNICSKTFHKKQLLSSHIRKKHNKSYFYVNGWKTKHTTN